MVVKGLAGAAAMAGATQAYGAVVTVTPPPNIVGNNPANTSTTPVRTYIDVDGNGTNDLEIAYRSFTTGAYVIQQSFVFSLTGATASYALGTQYYAYQLTAGTSSAGLNFAQSTSYLTHIATHVNSNDYGFWYLGDKNYLEFSFKNANGNLDFGYIQLETDAYVSAANPGGVKFFSAAYDNTSGTPIVAGAVPVPEPGTLGALAFGGATVAAAAYRRRKQAAQA